MGLLVVFAQLLNRQKAWLSMHRGLGAVDFPAGAVACCASCWEFSLAVVCEVGLGWKTVQDEAGMRDVWGPSVHTAALLLSSASQLHLPRCWLCRRGRRRSDKTSFCLGSIAAPLLNAASEGI